MSTDRLPFDEIYLREKLNHNPKDWDARLRLADGLHEKEAYAEAAEIIWSAKYIPSHDLDLALSIHILTKAQPRKAIRLITAVLELNQGKPANNMAMANAMLHYGMVLQSIRFYGAALEVDPTLVNPDIEYLMLWSDDKNTTRGVFGKKLPKLNQVTRAVREANEDLRLTSRINLHEMPICLPDLPIAAGEEFKQAFQEHEPVQISSVHAPISQSVVPTSVLRVKWGAAPTTTEDQAIPVSPPPVAPSASPFEAAPPAPGPRRLNFPGS